MNHFFHISSAKEYCEKSILAFQEIQNFNDYRKRRHPYIINDEDYTSLDGYKKYEDEPLLFLKENLDLFLTNSSRVSRIFWPTRRNYKKRGEELRHLIQLDNNHPLKTRNLRNVLEHEDENIDDWLENDTSVKIKYSISDKPPFINTISSSSKVYPPKHIFLFHFDRLALKFYHNEKIYDLKELFEAIKDVCSKLKKGLN